MNPHELNYMKYRLEPGAKKPTKSYPGDAGWDLYTSQEVAIGNGQRGIIKTGVFVSLPHGFWAHLVSRSSTLGKHGLLVIDAVIDNGYRGELFVQVQNPGTKTAIVPAGNRIAQLVLHRIHDVIWDEVQNLPESKRGENGFGSSGR